MRSTPSNWIDTLAKLGFKRRTQSNTGKTASPARRLRFEPLEARRVLATVTTHLDVNDDFDGLTTLREAIEKTSSGGVVDFSSSLNGATLELDLGQIAFNKSLTIDASMLPNGITIDAGNQDFRIFSITDTSGGSATPTVEMKGMTLTGGDAPYLNNGGAIYSNVDLTLQNMTISGNSANGDGGGLYANLSNGGAITIIGSTFDQNMAGMTNPLFETGDGN